MHAAVGDGDWFADARRAEDLADGFAEGCSASGRGLGRRGDAGAEGDRRPRRRSSSPARRSGGSGPSPTASTGDVRDGDAIVFLASSGVQTNGLTLCRAIADRLPQGYLTPIDDGRTYGEALLDASVIYVPFVAALQQAGVQPHYAAHVTGHGWRKLMRLDEPFVYRMTDVREPLPVFQFLMQAGPVDLREAYATFNMGVGFAVYVDPNDADACLRARDARPATTPGSAGRCTSRAAARRSRSSRWGSRSRARRCRSDN